MSIRDYDKPADRIRQHRQSSDAPIVIVEGPSDQRILREHLESVSIFPVSGKVNVVSCARKLRDWKIERFICITDNDFDDSSENDDLEGYHYPYLLRDLEAMLIELGVLSLVLEYLGSSDKIESFGGVEALVRRLQEIVQPISFLRFQSARENWGLSFDQVDLSSKIDKRDLRLKTQNYCAALVQASDSGVTNSMLLSAIEDGKIDGLGARGKDVLIAALVALRQVAGSLPHAVKDDVLLSQLHSSSGLAISRSSWLENLKIQLCLAS